MHVDDVGADGDMDGNGRPSLAPVAKRLVGRFGKLLLVTIDVEAE